MTQVLKDGVSTRSSIVVPRTSRESTIVGPLAVSKPREKLFITRPALKHLPFPPEIRDSIYKFVLMSEEFPPLGHIPIQSTECLNLLLASKVTYLEAFHIFYRYNNLAFQDVSRLFFFLNNIGYARLLHVTHVTFAWQGTKAKEAFRLLQHCPSLRRIDIVVTHASMDGTFMGWNDGAQTLREVCGLEVVNFLAAVEPFNDGIIEIEPWSLDDLTIIDPSIFTPLRIPMRHRVSSEMASEMQELRRDMMRPRSRGFALKVDEKMNPF